MHNGLVWFTMTNGMFWIINTLLLPTTPFLFFSFILTCSFFVYVFLFHILLSFSFDTLCTYPPSWLIFAQYSVYIDSHQLSFYLFIKKIKTCFRCGQHHFMDLYQSFCLLIQFRLNSTSLIPMYTQENMSSSRG